MVILVVDDSPDIRACLSDALRLHGHLTAACEGAEAALYMIPWVDCVIVDGLEGDWLTVVNAAERAGKAVCLFTGDEAIAEDAERSGVAVVRKPGSVARLLGALEFSRVILHP